MGFWRRLFGREEKEPPASLPTSDVTPSQAPPAAEAAPSIEAWLSRWVEEIASGKPATDVAIADLWDRIDSLAKDGHERLAALWLGKLAVAIPPSQARDAVRARAAELHWDRGEVREALPHLEALTSSLAHAPRAHFLLGEHFRAEGDMTRALRHFESVLALDMGHPHARTRWEELRGAVVAAPEAVRALPRAGNDSPSRHRYHLQSELGRGSTGTVYLARDNELGRNVAIKVLSPHFAGKGHKGARARLFSEARIAAQLRHPHIVGIYDIDEAQRRIVMELCAGGTLARHLRDGKLPVPSALRIHVELLSALAAAHGRGVVHRDPKPANLLFRREPGLPGAEIVLCDFGIAHLGPGTVAGGLPAPGRPEGTVAYMAPEQRRGEALPPSDVHAAAVILYETLVGNLPWTKEALLRGTRDEDDLALPEALRAALPVELAGPLEEHLRALGHKDAGARPNAPYALKAARQLLSVALVGVELLERLRAERAELMASLAKPVENH
ncbi:MAG: serine/threonine protein kinase [Deltaproteobacteria bacterium]|nr:serine/threonine protein kinase [Deltaproteobacteria bacterium]